MKTVKTTDTPLRCTMCKTCPFRLGSPYGYLKEQLMTSALSESRICHSTGSNSINAKTGIKSHLCRGARDFQLIFMAGLGVIASPTDEAWNEARRTIGLEVTTIADPQKIK